MATRLYLPLSVASQVSPAFDAEWENTGSAIRNQTHTVKQASTLATSTLTVPASNTVPYDLLVGQWVSQPLDSNQTITGTVKGQIRVHESNAAADLRAQLIIRVVTRDGSTVRGTLLAADTGVLANEFTTSLTNRQFPVGLRTNTLTSVSAQTGDRVVIEVGLRQHTSGISRTSQFSLGDSAASDLAEDETSTAANNPWLELSQSLTFETAARVTQDYVEVLDQPSAAARITQAYVEILDQPSAAARITQVYIEVLTTAAQSSTATDTTTTSESIARVTAAQRALGDTTATSESIARAVGWQRTAADTTTASEMIAGTFGRPRTAADTVTTSESLARLVGLSRALADTSSFSEAVSRVTALFRALADTTSISDSVDGSVISGSTNYPRSADDTVSGSESVARLLAASRVPSDTTSTTESPARALALGRGLSDTVSGSDSLAAVSGIARPLADTVSGSETVARMLVAARAPADSTSTSDSLSRLLALSRGITDTVSSSDSITMGRGVARTVSDTVSSSDAIATAGGVARSLSDTVTTSATLARSIGRTRALSEGLTTSSSVSRRTQGSRQPTDRSVLIEFPLPLKGPAPTATGPIPSSYTPTLTTTMAAGATSITVSSAPSAGNSALSVPFVVNIAGTAVTVTSVSGTTWTIAAAGGSAPSGTRVLPALVRITVGGADITAYVNYKRSRFSTYSQGNTGTCEIWVRDLGRALSFVTGAEIVVSFRGIRVWAGYVGRIRHEYMFSTGTGSNNQPRYLVIEGPDYNILFSTRIYHNKTDPTNVAVHSWYNGTMDRAVIGQSLQYLDLGADGLGYDIQPIGTPSQPNTSCSPTASDVFSIGSAGATWGQTLNAIAGQTGGIFYIDPDKVFHYVDDSVAQSSFGYTGATDDPAQSGSGYVGYRDFEWLSDGSKMVNEQFTWGTGQGAKHIVLGHAIDDYSTGEHGLWQGAELRYDMYCQATVNRRADSWLYGSSAHRFGYSEDRESYRFTVFVPYFRVADVIRVQSNTFGMDTQRAVRGMEITFLTPWDIQCVLMVSTEIDIPWNMLEFFWPNFDFNFGGGTFVPPTLPPPIGPPVIGWPPVWGPAGDCLGVCAVHDTFTRTAYPDWYSTDTGETWVVAGSRIGGVDGALGVIAHETGWSSSGAIQGEQRNGTATLPMPVAMTLPVDWTFRMAYSGVWQSQFPYNPDFAQGELHPGVYNAPGFADAGTPTAYRYSAGSWQQAFLEIRTQNGIPMHAVRIYNAGGSMWISHWMTNAVVPWSVGIPTLVGAMLQPGQWLKVRYHADSDQVRVRVWLEGSPEPTYWQHVTQASGSTFESFIQFDSYTMLQNSSQPAYDLYIDDVCVNGGPDPCSDPSAPALFDPGSIGSNATGEQANRGDTNASGTFFLLNNQFQSGSTEVWVAGLRIRPIDDYYEYPRSAKILILNHIDVTAPKAIMVNYTVWSIDDPHPL